VQEFNKKVDDSEAARLLGEAKLHQSAIAKAEANKDKEQVRGGRACWDACTSTRLRHFYCF
jgi:hypothetical protein